MTAAELQTVIDDAHHKLDPHRCPFCGRKYTEELPRCRHGWDRAIEMQRATVLRVAELGERCKLLMEKGK